MNAPRACSEHYQEAILRRAWAGEEEAELMLHAASCPDCGAAVDAELLLSAKVNGSFEPPPGKVGEGLARAVFERTTRKQKSAAGWLIPGSALAGAAVAAGVFFYARGTEEELPEDPASFAEMDLEVLENMELIENLELLEVLDALESMGDG